MSTYLGNSKSPCGVSITLFHVQQLYFHFTQSSCWVHFSEFAQSNIEVSSRDLSVSTGDSLQDCIMKEDILVLLGRRREQWLSH